MKDLKLFLRLLADLAMIGLVAWAPIWAIAIFALAFAWVFAPYYEIILVGLALGALYGHHSFLAVIVALVVFVAIEIVKKRTRI